MEKLPKTPQRFINGQSITVLPKSEIIKMNLPDRFGIPRQIHDYAYGGMYESGIMLNCKVSYYLEYNFKHNCWAIDVSFIDEIGRGQIYTMLEKEFEEYYLSERTSFTQLYQNEIKIYDILPETKSTSFKISYKDKQGKDKTETVEANSYIDALSKIQFETIYYHMEL